MNKSPCLMEYNVNMISMRNEMMVTHRMEVRLMSKVIESTVMPKTIKSMSEVVVESTVVMMMMPVMSSAKQSFEEISEKVWLSFWCWAA